MVQILVVIILGIVLLAKPQFDILRYRYKRAKICPTNIFPTGSQSYRLTKLAEEYPQRPTMFIPLLACWAKRPLFSEIAGTLIITGCLYWAWNYSANFPLILSVALGGLSWIFITKFVLSIMLKLCNYPSGKIVAMAVMIYPIMIVCVDCLFILLAYFNIYKLPF